MSVTMRAVRFDRFGPPGEVLVRVAAAGVNPSDVKNVGGSMRHLTARPRTPGRDFAGTVVDGPGDLNGADVFGTGGDRGSPATAPTPSSSTSRRRPSWPSRRGGRWSRRRRPASRSSRRRPR